MHAFKLCAVGALYQLVQCGLAMTALAQQPATLTLACKGTATWGATPDKKEPISMGLIVNFTSRTVQGFGYPGLIDYTVKITAANDVTVAFEGDQKLSSSTSSIGGTIDRVTGDVEARDTLS